MECKHSLNTDRASLSQLFSFFFWVCVCGANQWSQLLKIIFVGVSNLPLANKNSSTHLLKDLLEKYSLQSAFFFFYNFFFKMVRNTWVLNTCFSPKKKKKKKTKYLNILLPQPPPPFPPQKNRKDFGWEGCLIVVI